VAGVNNRELVDKLILYSGNRRLELRSM
jgi:hypothetical protein